MMKKKIYYLETNALYALANCFEKIADSKEEVVTSLFALEEIVDGIDAERFHKRKVLLSKILSSNMNIYPYFPEECIAIAFQLDISRFPQISKRKNNLMKKLYLIQNVNEYEVYCKEYHNVTGCDLLEVKSQIDKYEKLVKEKISEMIVSERKDVELLREKQKSNPEYIEIDIEAVFGLDRNDSFKYLKNKNVRDLLLSLLHMLNIQYEEKDIQHMLEERDENALEAFMLGSMAYECSKSLKKDGKLADRNDVNDLRHLLYLRDSNYAIVSDDNIYPQIIMEAMTVKTKEFKQIISC